MAAGEGQRMEGIKQLLPWKDSNFLLETVKTGKHSNADTVYIVLGAYAETIKNECDFDTIPELEVIVNPDWADGLGNSIAFGVQQLMNKAIVPDAVLICLADQPLVTTAYLNELIATYQTTSKTIIATQYKNKPGVPALFDKSVFEQLSQLTGDEGAKHILRQNSKDRITLEGEERIRDIDTKQEYEKLRQDYKDQRPKKIF